MTKLTDKPSSDRFKNSPSWKRRMAIQRQSVLSYFDPIEQPPQVDWTASLRGGTKDDLEDEELSFLEQKVRRSKAHFQKIAAGFFIVVILGAAAALWNSHGRKMETGSSGTLSGVAAVEMAMVKSEVSGLTVKRVKKVMNDGWKLSRNAFISLLHAAGFRRDFQGGLSKSLWNRTLRIYPETGTVHIIIRRPSGRPSFFMSGYATYKYDFSGNIDSVTYKFGPPEPSR